MLTVYVSGHGYGHSTRTAEVLRAVREREPRAADRRLHVRARPSSSRASSPRRSPVRRVECDVGLVQKDALVIDEEGTAAAWRDFVEGWDALVAREAAWLREAGARLVLGDIPPLAFAAAGEAGLSVRRPQQLLVGLDLRPPGVPGAGPRRGGGPRPARPTRGRTCSCGCRSRAT